mgnify:CR=1 FL=1
MMLTAHIAGLPLEELLPAVTAIGAMLAATRVWLAVHLRDRQETDR